VRTSILFRRALIASASIASIASFATAAMAQDANVVETVVVTGRRAAMQTAVKIKENADQLVDAVVADDVGKLPDNSITEVLQRVSGVTITHFAAVNDPDHYSVEGSGVAIRGMTQVNSTLNGRESFSANGGRSLLWEDVPPELMSAVNIYKSSTADQLEGGVGGSVDLRTHLPFDFDGRKISGSVGVNYGDLVDQGRMNGSLMLSDRWDTKWGEMGLLLDAAYSDIVSRSDTIQVEPYFPHGNIPNETGTYYIPGGYDFRTAQFDRKRAGFYEAFQWKPTENLSLYQTFFQSYYNAHNSNYGFLGTGGNGMTLDYSHTTWSVPSHVWGSNNQLLQADALYNQYYEWWSPMNCTSGQCSLATTNTGADKGSNRTTDITEGFNWTPTDNWRVTGAFQYVHSTSDSRRLDVYGSTMQPAFGIDLRGNYPVVLVSDKSALATASNYLWTATMDHYQQNNGQEMAANVDAEYNVGGVFWRSVKFGVRGASRLENDRETAYNYTSLSPWYASGTMQYMNASNSDDTLVTFDNFFRGAATLPGSAYFPSLAAVEKFSVAYFHQKYSATANDTTDNSQLTPYNRSHGKTDAFTAYVMGNFAEDNFVFGWPMSGNVGGRLVYNDNQSEGYATQAAQTNLFLTVGGTSFSTGTQNIARAGGRVSWTFLPSFNIQVQPTDQTHIRLALSESMGQLSFSAMKAGGSLSVSTVSVNNASIVSGYSASTGQPDLKPQLSRNLDLSFEWYGDHPGDQAHVSGFYKSIKNYITYGITTENWAVNMGSYGMLTEPTLINNYFNSSKETVIRGFELGATKFFDFLPWYFNGLGADANFTYIDSRAPGDTAYNMFGNLITSLPVDGLSRYSYNAALLYERDPFSIRVAYTWRSSYLLSTNANGTNGTYSASDNGVSCPANNYLTGGTGANGVAGVCTYNLPIFSKSYGQLDAGVQYKLNDNVTLSVEGQNLLNTVTKTTMGYGAQSYNRSWFMADRRIAGSVHFNF